jgi:hypothetical protein
MGTGDDIITAGRSQALADAMTGQVTGYAGPGQAQAQGQGQLGGNSMEVPRPGSDDSAAAVLLSNVVGTNDGLVASGGGAAAGCERSGDGTSAGSFGGVVVVRHDKGHMVPAQVARKQLKPFLQHQHRELTDWPTDRLADWPTDRLAD